MYAMQDMSLYETTNEALWAQEEAKERRASNRGDLFDPIKEGAVLLFRRK
jgi:hypothetical protein